MKQDVFKKYSSYYDMPFEHIPRPQPSDFVVDYFDYKEGLFFFDIGAYDGITWSNSLLLEEEYGWKGVCVEANPVAYMKLFKARDCKCYNYGISDVNENMKFWIISGYCEMLSGFVDFYDEKHKKRIESELKQYGGYINEVFIETKKLESLLNEEGVNKIDYLSIDVEGAELPILKGIDLEKIEIELISVENNEYNDLVENYMTKHGYKKITKICGDDFYKRAEK